MASKSVEITVPANADADDCLADAAEQYIAEHDDLRGYDLSPRWADDDRESVVLTVPRWHADQCGAEEGQEARMSRAEALAWAQDAQVGDYLGEYDDVDADRDPGSRCGYDDPTLDDVRRILRARGLTIETDDTGIRVEAR
jgi:hypothetical protein